ncbi:MAG: response regulator transcription factor [Spirochaetales bacterium]|nr:response regulator transcription factor [Spirochaetales bacterium]
MTVAIVEDEEGVREAVALAMTEAGYAVTTFRDGQEAWHAWTNRIPDLAILDIVMPRMDGLELCRRIRARSQTMPVIFLSSKDEEIDRVVGLELGADDYLCKPFSVRELVARVRALERRLRLAASGEAQASTPPIVSGELVLDPEAIRVRWRGEAIPLTVTEFSLLGALVRHAGAVLSREQLLRAAYPDDVFVTERSIDSHIRRIRRKFEETGATFEAISAVYGAGYRYHESGNGG